MIGSLVAIGCRTLCGAVFFLTAIWKMTHRREFESSFYRLAPGRVAGAARIAIWPIFGTEIALAAALPVGLQVNPLALIGPLVGFVLIVLFTSALALGDEGACGCWSTPPPTSGDARRVSILRNAVLLAALASAAALSPTDLHGVTFAAALAPVITGIILAGLLVEAPQIVAVATFDRRAAGLRAAR
jgi:hypothetical protein